MHQALLHYNESLTLLLMNPSPAAALAGGGKLPIAIYESVYEADDTDAKTLGLRFVPLNYTIDSGEAEMIGMDFVAKGAGNATSVPPAKQTKPVSEKGKEKAVPAEKSDKVDVGVQNDELLSNLTAKKNAINMLNARIKLLLSYLQNPPLGVTNHQILREIKSLTNSRLPLLRPANDRAYEKEKLAEESDVNLVILLGAVTKSIEEVRNVGRKSAGIDSMLKSKGKGGALDRVFDEGMDFGRRSRGGLGAFGF